MKSTFSNIVFFALLVLCVSFVAAECDGNVHNRHARAARAHRRQIIPRGHTSTTVDLVYFFHLTTLTCQDVQTTTASEAASKTSATAKKASLPDAVQAFGVGAAKRADTSAAATSTAAPEVHTNTGATANLALWKSPSVPFSDGTIDCSAFPSSQQGVVSVNYLGFGGWSGIQYADDSTAISGMTCTEGAYCSYACQPGMSKTQWPTTQPSDGQSRGGLLCKGGKLYLTNPASQYLCEWGSQSSYVVNTLGSSVAICRTDYPGTENMVVPTVVGGNETLPLTVVNEDTYYKWQGKLTSAQYYVNKAGGSASSNCLWGTSSDDFGNWAPVNFGAGYTGGTAWLSIMYNPLQTSTKLDYNVKIECVSGTMNGECVYENGVIQQGGNGCTVSCNGVCHFVLY
jgi:hypothetical protein